MHVVTSNRPLLASGDDDDDDEGDAGTAAAAPPAWLKQHRIRLPTDWRARHSAAMKLPAQRAKWHKITWRILREMQSEDEERVRRGAQETHEVCVCGGAHPAHELHMHEGGPCAAGAEHGHGESDAAASPWWLGLSSSSCPKNASGILHVYLTKHL